jgi:hypothetical protein
VSLRISQTLKSRANVLGSFFLGSAALFLAATSAHSAFCPSDDEQQTALAAAGIGQDAIENVENFYLRLYGKPLREIRATDGRLVLQWIDPENSSILRNITIKVGIGGKPIVYCGPTF